MRQLLLLAMALAQLPAAAQSPAPQPAVQMGYTVVPETVSVGQPFRVRVRVRAPRGATVAFPAGPDSSGPVQALDPRQLGAAGDPSSVDETAVYRLAGWEVGPLALGLGDVTVRVDGTERRISLAGARVVVASVLPADTAQRAPKPARDIFAAQPPWWWPWLPIALAIALLLFLLWLWWRRRRRGTVESEIVAIEVAEREFSRVEAMGLLEAGERGRFVALMVDVLRDYLARRVPGAAASLTSSEVLQSVRGQRAVPVDRLAPLLAEVDLIKFARRPVARDRAEALGREARLLAREIERARAAEDERAAEAAADASRPVPPRKAAA